MRRRHFRWGLSLLSLTLLLVASGLYLIFNKDVLLAAYLNQRLQPYGVADVELQDLQLSTSALQLAGLRLTYPLGNQQLHLTLRDLEARYELGRVWRQLRGGDAGSQAGTDLLDQLNIAQLQVAIVAPTTATEPAATAAPLARLSELLPYQVLGAVPARQLNMQHWSVQQGTLQASGTLTLDQAAQTLRASAATSLGDLHLATEVHSAPTTPLAVTLQASTPAQPSLLSLTTELLDTGSTSPLPWQWAIHLETELGTLMQTLATQTRLQARWPDLAHSLQQWLAHLQESQLQPRGHINLTAQVPQPDTLTLAPSLQQFVGAQTATSTTAPHDRTTASLSHRVTLQQGDALQLTSNGRTEFSADPHGWQLHTRPSTDNSAAINSATNNASTAHWISLYLQPRALATTPLWRQLNDAFSLPATVAETGTLSLRSQQLRAAGHGVKLTELSALQTEGQALQLPTLAADLTLSLPDTRLTTQANAQQIAGNSQLRVASGKRNQARHQWQGQATLVTYNAGRQLTLNGYSQALALNLQLSAEQSAQQQNLDYTLVSLDLPRFKQQAKNLLPASLPWPQALTTLQLTQGNLTLRGKLAQTAPDHPWQAEHSLALEQINGLYDTIGLENLGFTATLQGLPGVTPLRMNSPAVLQMQALHLGTDLRQLTWQGQLHTTTADLQTAQITTSAFSSRIFDGELTLQKPFTYRLDGGEVQGQLQASGWQLGKLVALQKQPIQASGLLDGTLAFTLDERGFSIPDGRLQAREPGGTIRYPSQHTQALVANSPELGLAMRMLDNFSYRVLHTNLTLSHAGELHLGLSLNGKNPAEFNGRAVEFNINIDQNIFPLLESLRLSDQVIQQLEKRIQNRGSN